VQLDVICEGLVGDTPPALVVRAGVALDALDVALDCGGARGSHSGSVHAGQEVRVDLPATVGRHHCSGSLQIRAADGSEGDMPLSFDIEVFPPLTASAPADQLDLAQGLLTLTTSRPLSAVQLDAWGEHGKLLSSRDAEPADGGARVHWTPPAELVLRLDLLLTDTHGFQARLELFPWAYAVPHDDVVFPTGQASIGPTEQPKLEAAWATVEEITRRYGTVAAVNLYVAGFTDTVGDAASNRSLSEARARAIAGWFRDRGFSGSIWFQGFGERGLAVPTPDGVDEERNRRADYIIAAEPPPESETLPGSAWRRL